MRDKGITTWIIWSYDGDVVGKMQAFPTRKQAVAEIERYPQFWNGPARIVIGGRAVEAIDRKFRARRTAT